jgi:hypothetical protein
MDSIGCSMGLITHRQWTSLRCRLSQPCRLNLLLHGPPSCVPGTGGQSLGARQSRLPELSLRYQGGGESFILNSIMTLESCQALGVLSAALSCLHQRAKRPQSSLIVIAHCYYSCLFSCLIYGTSCAERYLYTSWSIRGLRAPFLCWTFEPIGVGRPYFSVH